LDDLEGHRQPVRSAILARLGFLLSVKRKFRMTCYCRCQARARNALVIVRVKRPCYTVAICCCLHDAANLTFALHSQ